MDQYPIKSVAFGGFDKQDVINYLDTQSREAAAAQERLHQENESLREKLNAAAKQLEDAASELEALRSQEARLREENTRLQEENEQLRADLGRESTAGRQLREEAERLRSVEAETEQLRSDAQAYAQFRERLGGIEVDARKRADDLERATLAQMRQTVEQFQAQYQALLATFKSTAGYVTGELRKVEVNLTQLPHAMDPATNALNALCTQMNLPPQKEEAEEEHPKASES